MAVRDIACPGCGDLDAVEKDGIGEYRCSACGLRFGYEELASEP